MSHDANIFTVEIRLLRKLLQLSTVLLARWHAGSVIGTLWMNCGEGKKVGGSGKSQSFKTGESQTAVSDVSSTFCSGIQSGESTTQSPDGRDGGSLGSGAGAPSVGMVEARRGTRSSDLWSGGPSFDLNARAGSVPGWEGPRSRDEVPGCPWMNLTVRGQPPIINITVSAVPLQSSSAKLANETKAGSCRCRRSFSWCSAAWRR